MCCFPAVLKSNSLRKTLGLPLLGLGAATPSAVPEPVQMFTSKPPAGVRAAASQSPAAPAGPVTYDVTPLPPSANKPRAAKQAKRKAGRPRKSK